MSSPTRQNTTGLKLLSSARSALHLPESTPFLHFETTDYFTPDGRDYPMPHNNIYIQVDICSEFFTIFGFLFRDFILKKVSIRMFFWWNRIQNSQEISLF